MDNIFQLHAIIDGVRTLKNNTLRLTIETQDIACFTPEQLATLFRLSDKQVYVAIKETPVNPDEIEVKEAPTIKGEKTPGQRLRAVLFVYYEQHKPAQDFETFYKSHMEKLIHSVKEKLN
jgi:plasmid replication initiation protein